MIIHLMTIDKKFTNQFILHNNKHFDESKHYYIFNHRNSHDVELVNTKNSLILPKGIRGFITLRNELKKANQIIIHGLFDNYLILKLFFLKRFLSAAFWVVWGGDLYHYKTRLRSYKSYISFNIKRSVIKKIGHLTTFVEGDYLRAREWYSFKGEWIKMVFYTSNIINETKVSKTKKDNSMINVLVNHSSTHTSHHLEVFEKLSQFDNVIIHCPLSYGDNILRNLIIEKGKSIFGSRFKPLINFLELNEYLDYLNSMDIVVFNHDRQQGFGNLTQLLSLGKKIFLNPSNPIMQTLIDMGFIIYSLSDLSYETFASTNFEANQKNRKLAITSFSESEYLGKFKKLYTTK